MEHFGVSVIVPVYNNAHLLPLTISRLMEYFSKEFKRFELIFVDDRSTDNSRSILLSAEAKYRSIRVIHHSFNRGQQQTIADGAMAASQEIVIIVDADLPCALTDLHKLALLAHEGTELVLGRRQSAGDQRWWRRWGSMIANFLFRTLYGYDIHDFGCGVAAVRRSLVEKFRQRGVLARHIKLDVLLLANNYVEVAISSSDTIISKKSSYTFFSLAKLLCIVIIYRFSYKRNPRY